MTDNEGFYDDEVAPGLARLGKACQDRGMSFVAAVEYAPGQVAETTTLAEGRSFATSLVHFAIRCRGNVDTLIMGLQRHGRENGHGSICLNLLDDFFASNGERGPSKWRELGLATKGEVGEALARRLEPEAWVAFEAAGGDCAEEVRAKVLRSMAQARDLMPVLSAASKDLATLHRALSESPLHAAKDG